MFGNFFGALQILSFLILVAACQPQPTAVLPQESIVVIPAGWFLMGQNEGPRSNQPRRKVYLDTFAIDTTEVTKGAFAKFVEESGYQTIGWAEKGLKNHTNEPVVGVVWREAEAYCRWVGKRLPTEAEWEKAARGTDGRRYPWGNHWEQGRANVAESGYGGVIPVGSYPAGASPYGVLDMAGNAAEWVADYFDFTYYRYAPDRNPVGPDQVMDRVLRGGSWASPRRHAQTYFRDSSHSAKPNMRVGFRCARSVVD
jgi:sulfatase modifying factor 1